MGTCTTDPATVLVDETSFFNWLNGDQTCPSARDVNNLLQSYADNEDVSSSSRILQLQATVDSMTKALDQRNIDVSVAKDRAAMTTRPEITASFYDGWFPLTRPLKHLSVPILIGFATLFFTLAIILLLELLGIRILLSVYVPYESMFNSSKYTQPFWLMAGVAAIFLLLTVYLFLR